MDPMFDLVLCPIRKKIRFEKCPVQGLKGDCWLWTGAIGSGGYAEFIRSGSHLKVHRFTYQLFIGPIPKPLQCDHLCRVRNCVNPDHLEAVTARENIFRGIGPAALNVKKTHCHKGHEFTVENTILWKGARTCRECACKCNLASYHKHRNAGRRTLSNGEVA